MAEERDPARARRRRRGRSSPSMATFAHRTYAHATSERIGNTKTYGVVHGEFEVLAELPARLRHGVFAEARTFPAWVRFGGPGPLGPPDPRDNGLLSVGVKLMDVPGPKLLDDEQHTQDFTGISSPTFTTPDVVENVKLQRRLLQGLPAFYFLDPRDSHLLDAVMQGLYTRMNTSPLEVSYWSCVPYLLGEGQAMRYALHPREDERTPVPARPAAELPAPRDGQNARRAPGRIRLQGPASDGSTADADRERVGDLVERRSPPVTVARLRLPVQQFDSPEQHAFARSLSFQPWHCVAGAPPARKPEPSTPRDLLRALEATPGDERRPPRRAGRQGTFPGSRARPGPRAEENQVPVEIEHRDVEANGIRFHVASSGPQDAPTIRCLHGFPEGWMVWRAMMERLPESRVYAPDLRGYPGLGSAAGRLRRLHADRGCEGVDRATRSRQASTRGRRLGRRAGLDLRAQVLAPHKRIHRHQRPAPANARAGDPSRAALPDVHAPMDSLLPDPALPGVVRHHAARPAAADSVDHAA